MTIRWFKRSARKAVEACGYEIRKKKHAPIVEMAPQDREMIAQARPYTMTSEAGLWATLTSIRHVVRNRIGGAFVECGVWRGGQAMLAAMALKAEGELRPIWLFDTFAGMTIPAEFDVGTVSAPATEVFAERRNGKRSDWCFAPLEEVRENLKTVDYGGSIEFIEGDVAQTLRSEANLPTDIAILRLDTDWYESTSLELNVLYPRLVRGGILIIDDYGWWAGARKAVDEYFATLDHYPLLHAIDFTERVFVKI